jgi:hypothetical protein
MTDLPKPDYARNMRIIGHSDQGGRPDGVQIMVHRGYAYIGHMFSKGFSVVDVRDPKRPRAVNYLAAAGGGASAAVVSQAQPPRRGADARSRWTRCYGVQCHSRVS